MDDKEVIDPHTILSEEEIKDLKGIFELFDEDRRSEFGKNCPRFAPYLLAMREVTSRNEQRPHRHRGARQDDGWSRS